MAVKVPPPTYKCSSCGAVYSKLNDNFYYSKNSIYEANNNRTTVCRKCINEMYENYVYLFKDKAFAFYYICSKFGWYYNDEKFDLVKNKAHVVSDYISSNNTGKHKGKTFEDNICEEFEKLQNKREQEQILNIPEYSSISQVSNIQVDIKMSPEILIKWGTNFESHEYANLENLYAEMITVNPRMEETPQDKDYLKKICLTSVLLDRAYTEGDEKKIKSLSDAYSKLMSDSKLRAMDKTEADKSGGLRSFSQIYQEVESDNFIPPWEKYRKLKGINQDIVDKTIMHIENHTRNFTKTEKYSEPPIDTPKLSLDEIDSNTKAFRDSISESDD